MYYKLIVDEAGAIDHGLPRENSQRFAYHTYALYAPDIMF